MVTKKEHSMKKNTQKFIFTVNYPSFFLKNSCLFILKFLHLMNQNYKTKLYLKIFKICPQNCSQICHH